MVYVIDFLVDFGEEDIVKNVEIELFYVFGLDYLCIRCELKLVF